MKIPRAASLFPAAVLAAACTTGTKDVVDASDSAAREQPIELGTVRWERDHDAAIARAEREDKDVLLLFQEVPG